MKIITSKEQAIEKLGKLGASIWGSVKEYDEFTIFGGDYTFDKRTPKFESLTDEDLAAIFDKAEDVGGYGCRAVVTADRERERAILEQQTEEELVDLCYRNTKGTTEPLVKFVRRAIATVRAHDRAKGQQYPEPRPVSEWTEEMGRQTFMFIGGAGNWCYSERKEPYPYATHFLPVLPKPKDPK